MDAVLCLLLYLIAHSCYRPTFFTLLVIVFFFITSASFWLCILSYFSICCTWSLALFGSVCLSSFRASSHSLLFLSFFLILVMIFLLHCCLHGSPSPPSLRLFLLGSTPLPSSVETPFSFSSILYSFSLTCRPQLSAFVSILFSTVIHSLRLASRSFDAKSLSFKRWLFSPASRLSRPAFVFLFFVLFFYFRLSFSQSVSFYIYICFYHKLLSTCYLF